MKRLSLACLFVWLLVLVCSLPVSSYQQQKLTNNDVVKMVKAGLPADLIVQTIKSSTPDFDVSADGLIGLKQNGVPDSIIQAMVARAIPSTQPTEPVSPGFGQPDAANTGVFLIDAENRTLMRRATPTSGTSGGAMKVVNPFGKINVLSRFSDNHAQLRTSNPSPAFEASIPGDFNPSDIILLVKLSVKSDRREISVGSARINVSAGVKKEDTLPISISELPIRTTSGLLKTYRISVVAPLLSGEYAILLQGGVFYDFGVDKSK